MRVLKITTVVSEISIGVLKIPGGGMKQIFFPRALLSLFRNQVSQMTLVTPSNKMFKGRTGRLGHSFFCYDSYARERAKHLPDVGINGIEIPVETLRVVFSPLAEGMSFLHIRTKQS